MSRVELSFAIEGRKGETGRGDVKLLLRDGGFDIVGVTLQQVEIAIDAFRRVGRGRHRARLNIGDCFAAYALAIATDHSCFSGAMIPSTPTFARLCRRGWRCGNKPRLGLGMRRLGFCALRALPTSLR